MKSPFNSPFFRRLTFRSWLVLGVGAWALIAGTASLTIIYFQGREAERGVININLIDRLNRAAFRVDQLYRAAELSVGSVERLTPLDHLDSDVAWQNLVRQTLPVFEQRPELTRLGLVSLEEGKHGFLHRSAEGTISAYFATAAGEQTSPIQTITVRGYPAVAPATAPPPGPVFPPPPVDLGLTAAETGYWSNVAVSAERDEPQGIAFIKPVTSASGDKPAYWYADYSQSALSAFADSLQVETGLSVLLLDATEATPLLLGGPGAGVSSVDLAEFLLNERFDSSESEELEVVEFRFGDGQWVGAQRHVSERYPRWRLIGAMPSAAANVAAFTSRSGFLTVGAIFGLGAVLIVAILARFIARPLEDLATAVARSGENGEIDFPDITTPREVGNLSRVLRSQTELLIERQNELTHTNQRLHHQVQTSRNQSALLEAIFDNTPFDFWTLNPNLVYTYQNRYAKETNGDVLGKSIAQLDQPEELKNEWTARAKRVLGGEVIQRDSREEIAGGTRYFHTLEAPIKTGDTVVGALGIKIETTTQRRAEEALRISQARISRHLENTPLGVVEFDRNFLITAWNSSATVIFGWSTEEAIGRPGKSIVPEQMLPIVDSTWTKLLSERKSSRNFNQNRTKDGRIIDCEWYNTPIIGDQDEVVGVSSLVLDVTERMVAERLFRESEERFQRAFNLSPTPQAIISYPERNVLDVNDRWTSTFGWNRNEIIGRFSHELELWSDPGERRNFYRKIERTGNVTELETRLKSKDKTPHTVLVSAVRTMLGVQECVLLSYIDITERQAAETALQKSRQLLETVVSQLPGVVFRCKIDRNWTMLWISPHVKVLTGHSPQKFLSGEVTFTNLTLPEYHDKLWRGIQSCQNRVGLERTYEVEYQIKRRDGELRWIFEQGEIVRDPDTQIDHIVGFVTDITARKEAEERLRDLNANLEHRVSERTAQLERANQELTELDRLKTEFLATMSHELRTPLNSIIGFSSILERGMVGPLQPEQKLQISLVNKSAVQLMELINDLLDVSRIDSGRMEFSKEAVDMQKIVAAVVAELKPELDQRASKLRLNTEFPEPLPMIHSDASRVHQIVLNLAANAVKFTPQGTVTIRVKPTSDNGVSIVVTDTGIGIKAEHLPQLFEAFRQIDGSARRVYEGVGLGLNLVRKLAAKLGGQVEVESEYGRGSRFTVVLPSESPIGSPRPAFPSHADRQT